MVFGHLLESHLQYHTPENFWRCFRLWGEPINVREQQDAFEFFTHLIDQIDEYLIKKGWDPVFKPKFEGTFTDQKICQGCPHRYIKILVLLCCKGLSKIEKMALAREKNVSHIF